MTGVPAVVLLTALVKIARCCSCLVACYIAAVIEIQEDWSPKHSQQTRTNTNADAGASRTLITTLAETVKSNNIAIPLTNLT